MFRLVATGARNCLATGFGPLLKQSGKLSSVRQCFMNGLLSRPKLLASKQALTTSLILPFSSRSSTAPFASLGFRGIWIRGRAGRHSKIWKKSYQRRRRTRQHVFTNATQSYLLDKMVTRFWRKPKYYVDDPYEPYHSREEFYMTRRKPYVPVD